MTIHKQNRKGWEGKIIAQMKEDFHQTYEQHSGNDSALLSPNVLISQDLYVEGTHFTENMPLEAIIYKSLVGSLSDILSDGSIPHSVLFSFGVPETRLAEAEEMYSYLRKYLYDWGIQLVGGDTVRSPQFLLMFTAIGAVHTIPWFRKRAQEGDYIYVSGSLGYAKKGLESFLRESSPRDLASEHRYFYPHYQGELVKHLRKHRQVHGAIDISDGLFLDLKSLLQEAHLSAMLNEKAMLAIDPLLSLEDIFLSAEEYALLWTSPDYISSEEWNQLYPDFQNQCFCIGKLLPGEGEIILQKEKGEEEILLLERFQTQNFQHFEKNSYISKV